MSRVRVPSTAPFCWCHSQVVRRRSAKPLFSSSNLDGTSRRNPAESTSAGFSFFFRFRNFWPCCLFCCLLVISPFFSSSPGRLHRSYPPLPHGRQFRFFAGAVLLLAPVDTDGQWRVSVKNDWKQVQNDSLFHIAFVFLHISLRRDTASQCALSGEGLAFQ